MRMNQVELSTQGQSADFTRELEALRVHADKPVGWCARTEAREIVDQLLRRRAYAHTSTFVAVGDLDYWTQDAARELRDNGIIHIVENKFGEMCIAVIFGSKSLFFYGLMACEIAH